MCFAQGTHTMPKDDNINDWTMQVMMKMLHVVRNISMTDFYEHDDETSFSMQTRAILNN
jgi:hypothetical protein